MVVYGSVHNLKKMVLALLIQIMLMLKHVIMDLSHLPNAQEEILTALMMLEMHITYQTRQLLVAGLSRKIAGIAVVLILMLLKHVIQMRSILLDVLVNSYNKY